MTYQQPVPPPGWQPPPVPPIQPQPVTTSHLVHLVLTIVTCGLWLIMWVVAAASNSRANTQMQQHYAAAVAQYTHDLWMWEQQQRR